MKATHAERRNVSTLATAQCLFTITTITVMTLSSVIGLDLAPNPNLATLPIALMMLATVFTTLPASLFMKRCGRRLGFTLGTLLGALGGAAMLTGLALPSFSAFCAGMFLIGLYQSFAMYYRFAAADIARPEYRSRAVSLVMVGGFAAAILGPLNARLALNWIEPIPNGGPFAVIITLSVLAGIVLSRLDIPATDRNPENKPASSHNDTSGASRPLGRIARHPGFLPAVLGSSVCFTLMALYMTVTPLGMKAQGFNMTEITLVVQSQVLFMFGPAFITGTLIARFGLQRILWCGVSLFSLAMLIGAFSHTVPTYMLSRIALGVGWNFLFIGSAVLISTTHNSAERGKVQGINDMAMFSLVTVGSISAAALLHRLGWSGLHLASLIPLALVALALLNLRRAT